MSFRNAPYQLKRPKCVKTTASINPNTFPPSLWPLLTPNWCISRCHFIPPSALHLILSHGLCFPDYNKYPGLSSHCLRSDCLPKRRPPLSGKRPFSHPSTFFRMVLYADPFRFTSKAACLTECGIALSGCSETWPDQTVLLKLRHFLPRQLNSSALPFRFP